MKRKTLLAIFLALVVSLAAVFAFAGCDDGNNNNNDGDNNNSTDNDTHVADNSFVGYLSEITYEDATSAARGFLSEELDGAATSTQFVDAQKGKDLTSNEIASLELGDDINVADIESASYYTVTYTEGNVARAVAADAGQTKTYEIIIIKIGSHYYYYIPIMPKGGVITNSYISMVCDAQKYLNVTETTVSTTTTNVEGMTMAATVTSTAKLAGDRAYVKMVSTVVATFMGESETMEEVEEYYIVTEEDGVYMYSYNEYSNSWQRGGKLPYDSWEDYVLESLFKFDHSYFERTNSGFKMTEDKLQQYLSDVMGNLAAGYTVDSASANYYVKDARLDEIVVNVSMNGALMTSTAHTTYTNYGTTVIELPFDVE